MFLSPVPGSPAEEQPPPAADFYPQAKLGFGGLSMDDEGDARMSSPLATPLLHQLAQLLTIKIKNLNDS